MFSWMLWKECRVSNNLYTVAGIRFSLVSMRDNGYSQMLITGMNMEQSLLAIQILALTSRWEAIPMERQSLPSSLIRSFKIPWLIVSSSNSKGPFKTKTKMNYWIRTLSTSRRILPSPSIWIRNSSEWIWATREACSTHLYCKKKSLTERKLVQRKRWSSSLWTLTLSKSKNKNKFRTKLVSWLRQSKCISLSKLATMLQCSKDQFFQTVSTEMKNWGLNLLSTQSLTDLISLEK